MNAIQLRRVWHALQLRNHLPFTRGYRAFRAFAAYFLPALCALCGYVNASAAADYSITGTLKKWEPASVGANTGVLNLSAAPGKFVQQWYNPRTGEFQGDSRVIEGDKSVALGSPPAEPSEDWVVLIRKARTTVFPGKSWEQREPAQAGMNGDRLSAFAEKVGGDGFVVKDGYQVKAWGNQTPGKWWASASKPVLSTLLLLAVQEGKLPSVDAPVRSLGWELSDKDSTMTFRHLANMVSGYACGEAPGAAWSYNDFAIQLYALSLEKVFQKSLEEAFQERMVPLQLEDRPFFGFSGGLSIVASPRDFARLGWLWLNQGKWNGKEMISKSLYLEHIKPEVPANLPRTESKGSDYLGIGTYGGGTDQTPYGPGVYGFNFWFNEPTASGKRVWPSAPADTYQANGMWNRDTVTVFPSLRMVVAVRGAKAGKFEPGREDGEFNQNLRILVEAVVDVPRYSEASTSPR